MSKYNFQIDYYKVLKEDPYTMLLEAYIVSEGGNRHKTWFDIDAIQDSIHTLANKPMICIWDKLQGDFQGHAYTDGEMELQDSVGCIPESNKAEIVEYKGKQFLKCTIAIWKHYYPQVAEKLSNNGDTKISMEIDALETHMRDDGYESIDKFTFMGITLVGMKLTEAIPNARVKVIKYTTEDYDKLVKETNLNLKMFTIPTTVKDNAINALEFEQKNVELVKFAKQLRDDDKLSYGSITWMFSKINNLRKQDNLIFYGGKEGRDWCKNIILQYEKEDVTNFPEDGDNKKISLSNSKYDTFPDYNYVLKIKEDYPEIWKMAGNVGEEWNGDKTFKLWGKYRDGERSEQIEDWIMYREKSWMPRHVGHNKLKGCIAIMKWAGVAEGGVSNMKSLINEEKKKIDEKRKKKYTSITIDNSKDSAVKSSEWENPGSNLYDKLLDSDNSKSLLDEAYLIVEDEYKNSPSTSLKYPHHSVRNNKLVMNEAGVIAAGSRLNQVKSKGDISDSDYDKALRHINKHRKELDMEELERFAIKTNTKEAYSLSILDLWNMLSKMISEKEEDSYGYPKYQLDDIMPDEKKLVAYIMEEDSYVMMPYEIKGDKVEVDYNIMKKVYPKKSYIDMEEMKDNEEMMAGKMEQGMYSIMKEKSLNDKKYDEVLSKYSEIKSTIKSKDEELEKLRKYQSDKEEESLKSKAKELYTKNEEYLTEDEIKELDSKLLTFTTFKDFEHEVDSIVKPKLEAELLALKSNSNNNGIQVNFTNLPNYTKEKKGNENSYTNKLKELF